LLRFARKDPEIVFQQPVNASPRVAIPIAGFSLFRDDVRRTGSDRIIISESAYPFFLNRLFIPAGKVLMDKASSFFTIESNKGPAAARTVDSF
jgi:hypothetical protein